MNMENFVPFHINAEKGDFEGNGIHGRYVLLPGSEGRAEKIAAMWKDVTVKKHARNHNLYLGKMESGSGDIDMAVVSTGMGAPSADIIINELIILGARNLIRIGTSGSMQPEYIPAGSIVVPTGSVKDEAASRRYLPVEVPAVPSMEFLVAAHAARNRMQEDKAYAGGIGSDKAFSGGTGLDKASAGGTGSDKVFSGGTGLDKAYAVGTGSDTSSSDSVLAHQVFFGVVHSKDSLYAREMKVGPKREENEDYMKLLKDGGVLASEMETSILFTLGQIYSQQNRKSGSTPIMTGAVLAVIGGFTPFGDKNTEASAIDAAISFCLRTVEELYSYAAGAVCCWRDEIR